MVRTPRKIRDTERFAEIVGTLSKNGLGFLIHGSEGKIFRHRKHYPAPEVVRETLEELGPTFVKLGQFLATRPDLIPEHYIEELKKLQYQVPEFDHDKARRIVDNEIGLENFQEFHEEPIAAASIAQVHEAKLQNGDEVVLKIRRPNIEERIRADLDILTYLSKKIDKHSTYKDGFIQNEAEEFAFHTKDELDFMREMAKIKEFKEKTRDLENVKIPTPYEEYTTDKVLTLEKVEGRRIDEIDHAEKEFDHEKIISTGTKLIVKQIVSMGILHGDPHPSNIWVNEENQLILLDFGLTTRLTPKEQEYFTRFFYFIGEKDIDKIVDTIESMCHVEKGANLERFKKIAQRETLEIEYTPESYKTVSVSMYNLFRAGSENGIYFPTKLLILGKSFMTMEGIGLELEVDPKSELEGTVEKELRKSLDPRETFEKFMLNLSQNPEAISELPDRMANSDTVSENNRSSAAALEIEDDEVSHPVLVIVLLLVSSFLVVSSGEPNAPMLVGILGFVSAVYLLVEQVS